MMYILTISSRIGCLHLVLEMSIIKHNKFHFAIYQNRCYYNTGLTNCYGKIMFDFKKSFPKRWNFPLSRLIKEKNRILD